MELVNEVADRIAALVEHIDALQKVTTFNINGACQSLGGDSDAVMQRLGAAAAAAGKTFIAAARAVLSEAHGNGNGNGTTAATTSDGGAALLANSSRRGGGSSGGVENLAELAEEAFDSLRELARLCQHLRADGVKRAAEELADAIKAGGGPGTLGSGYRLFTNHTHLTQHALPFRGLSVRESLFLRRYGFFFFFFFACD